MSSEIVGALKDIAKSAPDEVLARIAKYDSHEHSEGTQRHHQSLKDLIHERDCVLDWKTMSWYPHEAIS